MIASFNCNPNDSTKYLLETKLHYGFVISHHKSMQHLTAGHFPAFEINIGKQTNGEKQWQETYKNPIMGITFWYANLANPNVLGSAYALYPYLNFHLYQSNFFSLNYRFGTGVGYLTKKFDRLDNYKNIAIGSHVNVTINMFYEFKWLLFSKIYASGGIGLTHFSNGALKMPNLGINIPTINLGLAYRFNSSEKIRKILDTNSYNKKHQIEIQTFLSGGMKEISLAGNNKYGAFSLSTCFLKPLSIKRKIGIGLDFFWDFSNFRYLEQNGFEVKHSYEVIKPGIHIGHQLEFSKLSFVTQIGFYLYAKDNGDGPTYFRIALRYKLTNKLLLNLALKTHLAKADFIEWGIGYVLK
jgi:hypothetical protein